MADMKKMIYGIWKKSAKRYVFIGSSTQGKSQRMTFHRSKARAAHDHPLHQLMEQDVADFELHSFEKTDQPDVRIAYYIQLYTPTHQEKPFVPQIFSCECGQVLASKAALAKHKQTLKHEFAMDPICSIRYMYVDWPMIFN